MKINFNNIKQSFIYLYIFILLYSFSVGPLSFVNLLGLYPPNCTYYEKIYYLEDSFDLRIGEKLPVNVCWKKTSFLKKIEDYKFVCTKVEWKFNHYVVGFNNKREICYIEINELVSEQVHSQNIINEENVFKITDKVNDIKYIQAKKIFEQINTYEFITNDGWRILYGSSLPETFPNKFYKFNTKYMTELKFKYIYEFLNNNLFKFLYVLFIPSLLFFIISIISLIFLFKDKFIKKILRVVFYFLFFYECIFLIYIVTETYLYGYFLWR